MQRSKTTRAGWQGSDEPRASQRSARSLDRTQPASLASSACLGGVAQEKEGKEREELKQSMSEGCREDRGRRDRRRSSRISRRISGPVIDLTSYLSADEHGDEGQGDALDTPLVSGSRATMAVVEDHGSDDADRQMASSNQPQQLQGCELSQVCGRGSRGGEKERSAAGRRSTRKLYSALSTSISELELESEADSDECLTAGKAPKAMGAGLRRSKSKPETGRDGQRSRGARGGRTGADSAFPAKEIEAGVLVTSYAWQARELAALEAEVTQQHRKVGGGFSCGVCCASSC